MTIIDFLNQNAKQFGDEVALVEINPLKKPEKYRTWREYNLIEPVASLIVVSSLPVEPLMPCRSARV